MPARAGIRRCEERCSEEKTLRSGAEYGGLGEPLVDRYEKLCRILMQIAF